MKRRWTKAEASTHDCEFGVLAQQGAGHRSGMDDPTGAVRQEHAGIQSVEGPPASPSAEVIALQGVARDAAPAAMVCQRDGVGL